MLDVLAFKLPRLAAINTAGTNSFREPIGLVDKAPILVIKNFIEGIYDYISTGKTTDKQTVRGLRALLELPSGREIACSHFTGKPGGVGFIRCR